MDARTYLGWICNFLSPSFGTRKVEGDPPVLILEHQDRRFHMREVFKPEDFIRASGDVVCDECGDSYYHHPCDMKQLDNEDRPFLRVACDGRRLKL